MHYLRKPRWRLPESAATPEAVFWNRRKLLAGGAALSAVAALGGCDSGTEATAQGSIFGAPQPMGLDTKAFDPKPATNPAYAEAGRAITPEDVTSTYNNFYEFGFGKQVYVKAQDLPTDGWSLALDGEVETPKTLAMEDLLKKMPIEERVVRHRCVEAWSMVVPWIGFPISALMAEAKPLASAKYLRFESFDLPEVAPEQRSRRYPWPYVEGLTIEEAANPLAFLVVGAYGKMLPKQFGAPVRLHTPWKYGFKSNKSITRISFTSERPVGLWEQLQASEYGFWANVNPAVAHPRWSQATERVLGTGDRVPTQIYNGYGEEVAGLYAGLEAKIGEQLFR